MSNLDLSILLGAGALSLAMFLPRGGRLRASLLAVLTALCLAQFWVEGWYWQFVPVYLLLGMVPVVAWCL
jgi:hypothetical protein